MQQDHATGRPRRFAIALKETGRLIGGVGLDGSTGDDSEEPALGYWLGEPYWGNGYAREAVRALLDFLFCTLGAHRVHASIDPRNIASAALLRSLGMRQEAHFRESFKMRGEWVDDVIFALLAQEWPLTEGCG